jgi:hypothetical protein
MNLSQFWERWLDDWIVRVGVWFKYRSKLTQPIFNRFEKFLCLKWLEFIPEHNYMFRTPNFSVFLDEITKQFQEQTLDSANSAAKIKQTQIFYKRQNFWMQNLNGLVLRFELL